MEVRLVLSLLVSGLALAQSPGTFTPTGSMNAARLSHSATLLPNGKVLITGGQIVISTIKALSSSAELYDPATGTFAAAGNMSAARVGHSATLLSTGQVLIAGGFDGQHRFASTEFYDPSAGTFTAGPNMTVARDAHTATLLNNGQVLIAGGFTPLPPSGQFSAVQFSAELYDPSTGTFIPTGNMNAPRAGHTATLLGDGKVLIDGGGGQDFLSAEIYDPADGTFSTVRGSTYDTSMMRSGAGPGSATLLPNGKVLFTLSYWDDTTRSTALYVPSTATFTPAADVTEGGSRTATLLGDGTVLVAGLNYSGGFPNNVPSHADLYDPAAGTFSATGNMTVGRINHTATLLPDGTVLLAGGAQFGGNVFGEWSYVATAEIYHPAVLTPSPVLYALPGETQGAIWHAATGESASSSNPAVAGEALAMYTSNLIEGGVIPPQVAIGGRLAEVLYFGEAPGYPGYSQVNFRVPNGIAAGSMVPVRLSYLDRSSNAVTVAVQ